MVALLTKTLGVVCPSCDYLNVVAAVRCMQCGAATDGSAPARVETKTETTPKHEPAAAPTAPEPAPPGLRRSTGVAPALQPPPKAAEPLATSPVAGSGSQKGQPARPTFQSSTHIPQATPAPAAAAAGAAPKFGLTVLAGPARGQRFRLGANGAQIGRSKGVILFPEDPFVSPLHATVIIRDGKLLIRDDGSTSGVYASISGQETILPGACFCTGLRLFRYVGAIEPSPPWNKSDVLVYGAPLPNGNVHYAIEEVLLGDRPGLCLTTPGPVLTIGQAKCDFSFPNDEGLAPKHCELAPLPTGAMVRDLSGGLGTFVRITGERALKAGDRVRIGQQTLQVEQV